MARNHIVADRRIPSRPADLARVLASPALAAELLGGTEQEWADFERRYAEANPVLDTLVEERAQLLEQERLRAGGRKPPRGITGPPTRHDAAGPGRRGRKHPYNRRAAGAVLDSFLPESEWPLAQFVAAVNPKNEQYQPLRTQLANAALSERVPAEGGALVPEILRSDLLMLVLEESIIRPRCHIVEMDSLRVPYPALDDVTHANATSVYGGVSAYWTEESAALTASAPAFGRILLEARKLTAYTTIPNELIADAGPMLEDWLRTAWPAALAWYFDDAAINGTGVGEPQGFLNAPAAIKVSATSGHIITMANLISAYVRFLPQALPGAVWLASPDVKQQLMLLSLTAQSATSNVQPIAPPSWFTNGQAIDGTPATLFGHPIYFSEKMPSCSSSNTTTAGALSLCNFGYYLLGERQQLQLATSQEYLFASDLTAYRMIERCDARVWPQSALSPRNGGSTLSPFVLVDTTS